MDPHDVPPPYSDVAKPPHASASPSRGYAPISEPTYEPPQATVPMQPSITNTTITVTPTGRGPHVPGSCPVCANTSWTGTYSCLAWFLCFFCFWNCGLCCCLCMRKKKCTKCGFTIN